MGLAGSGSPPLHNPPPSFQQPSATQIQFDGCCCCCSEAGGVGVAAAADDYCYSGVSAVFVPVGWGTGRCSFAGNVCLGAAVDVRRPRPRLHEHLRSLHGFCPGIYMGTYINMYSKQSLS